MLHKYANVFIESREQVISFPLNLTPLVEERG